MGPFWSGGGGGGGDFVAVRCACALSFPEEERPERGKERAREEAVISRPNVMTPLDGMGGRER